MAPFLCLAEKPACWSWWVSTGPSLQAPLPSSPTGKRTLQDQGSPVGYPYAQALLPQLPLFAEQDPWPWVLSRAHLFPASCPPSQSQATGRTDLAPSPLWESFLARVNCVYKIDCDFSNSV